MMSLQPTVPFLLPERLRLRPIPRARSCSFGVSCPHLGSQQAQRRATVRVHAQLRMGKKAQRLLRIVADRSELARVNPSGVVPE